MVTSIDIPTSSSSGMSPFVLYRRLQQTAEKNAGDAKEASNQDALAKQLLDIKNMQIRIRNVQVKADNALAVSDATYVQNRMNSATTVNELVNDDRVLKVLANAYGVSDLYTFNKQRLKDVLLSDLNDANSVARRGTTKELELARKFNLGATGSLTDTNGNAVTIDSNGKVRNDGTGTPLEAGLAKIKNLVINNSGQVALNTDGSVLTSGNLPNATANAYTKAKTKTPEKEQTLPANTTSKVYEFDSPEFQRFRSRADIQREEEYFKSNVKNLKSVDDFFADKRIMRFVLSAYDLESELPNTGKIRKIMESNLSDVDSLANRFQDARFKQLAQDLDFFGSKVGKLTSQSVIDNITTKYERLKYEQSLDEQAPGVRAALEFKRRAKDVTQTVQLLGDSVLREVVTVANNIPKQIAVQEVGAQITALERKVDIKKFKDSSEVDKMVIRYLNNKASEAAGATGNYLLNLFG